MKRSLALLLVLALLPVLISAAADTVTAATARVDFFMRSQPDADSARLQNVRKGDKVRITGDMADGWYPVQFSGRDGWAKESWLNLPKVQAVAQGSDRADPHVVNLILDPEAAYTLRQDVPLLQVYYPTTKSADACIIRYGDTVAMVDCATTLQYYSVIKPLLDELGITRVDLAFLSHPHDDHAMGYLQLVKDLPIGQLILPPSYDDSTLMRSLQRTIVDEYGVPCTFMADGDEFRLGNDDNAPVLTVIQRTSKVSYTENDRSATFMIHYGDRSLWTMADVGSRMHQSLLADPPAISMKADIIKYPHHGAMRVPKELLGQMDPELAIITSHYLVAKKGIAVLDKLGIPWLSTRDTQHPNPYSLITDGVIWVVDRMALETILE